MKGKEQGWSGSKFRPQEGEFFPNVVSCRGHYRVREESRAVLEGGGVHRGVDNGILGMGGL